MGQLNYTIAQLNALLPLLEHLNLGWIDYRDTQYTELSPLSVDGLSDVALPNNAGEIRNTYKPTNVNAFYSGGTILGIEGDAYVLSIEYKIKPTNANTTFVDTWVDIGGAVGELYRRPNSFPKGINIERPVFFSSGIYTLDTWAANGGTVYIRTNGSADVYGIRYVIYRIYQA